MISTKGRYALRLMIDIAEHPDDGYIPLKDIAERQEISKKHLEIIAKDAPPCNRSSVCKTLPLWKEFDKMVYDFFYGKTLADLL